MNLDHHFPCLSDASAAPASVPLRLQLAEIERELHQRRESYPGRVDKGRMTAHDAEYGVDIVRAIAEDLRHQQLLDQWSESFQRTGQDDAEIWARVEAQQLTAARALAPFRWAELVTALQREILLRRRYYPQWVAKKTLDPIRARHQLERIEAVHFLYWVGARHFMPDALHGRRDQIWAAKGILRSAWAEAWHDHRAQFDPASDRGAYLTPDSQQQEMALL